nr:hypothetical protein Iba_chr10eCG5480 [Ipomoea batatas]
MLKISSSCIRGSSIVFHSFEAVDQCMLRSFSIASIVLAGCILLQKLQIYGSAVWFCVNAAAAAESDAAMVTEGWGSDDGKAVLLPAGE